MTRVTKPLFADSATGKLSNAGSFRMGRHGAEFIRQGGGGGKQPPQQEELKVEFARAISAWADSPKIRQKITNGYRMVHVTPWADFWRQWLADIQATKEQ